MNLRIDVYHHFTEDDPVIHSLLKLILEKTETIMATQAEATAKLQEVLAQQQKTAGEIGVVQTEVNTLKQTIEDLKAVIAAGNDQVSPELQAAIDAVAAQAQVVDDQIPDAPTA